MRRSGRAKNERSLVPQRNHETHLLRLALVIAVVVVVIVVIAVIVVAGRRVLALDHGRHLALLARLHGQQLVGRPGQREVERNQLLIAQTLLHTTRTTHMTHTAHTTHSESTMEERRELQHHHHHQQQRTLSRKTQKMMLSNLVRLSPSSSQRRTVLSAMCDAS
jgi:hypothetical protein